MTSNTGSGGKVTHGSERDASKLEPRPPRPPRPPGARGDVAAHTSASDERDALGRPLPSSLSDTDQSGTGRHEQWIGPTQGEHMRLHGPKARRTANYTRAELDLKRSVQFEMEREHRIDTTDLHVGVDDTEVTLTGSVPYRGMRNLAENVAQAVKGVTRVDNQLLVHGDSEGGGDQRAV